MLVAIIMHAIIQEYVLDVSAGTNSTARARALNHGGFLIARVVFFFFIALAENQQEEALLQNQAQQVQ